MRVVIFMGIICFTAVPARQTDIGGLGLVVYEEELDKDLTNVAMGFQYKF